MKFCKLGELSMFFLTYIGKMKRLFFSNIKRKFSTQCIRPKICVVGSGPAGFYATQHLIKKIPSALVDIYERLPVPFGLVRYGVAPDHPEVKNVINTFTKTAGHPNVQFLGNVDVGRDVTIAQLKEAYHVILLTYGAEESNKLDIPGENLENILSARNVVGWYNGLPSDKNLKIDLSGKSVAIFGQGNVAIDVARILLTPLDLLKKTDITQHALNQLASSKVEKVYLIGRRGPLQAAFTIKELREMIKLPACQTLWNKLDFNGLQEIVPSLQRPKKRIMELMLKSMNEQQNGTKYFIPVFFRSPLKFEGEQQVNSVELVANTLKGADILSQKAIATDTMDTLGCELAITSIGYRSVQADPLIPFDTQRGVVKNIQCKVEDGMYASGWLASGPTGVILTTMGNAFATAEIIAEDLQNISENRDGFNAVGKILGNSVQVVNWNDWLRIDKYEQKQGELSGKPREKIVDVKKMLEIASS